MESPRGVVQLAHQVPHKRDVASGKPVLLTVWRNEASLLQRIWRRLVGESGDLLQGSLELLVLKALSLEPMHGWGIGQRIDQLSRDVFHVTQGSLYPALQRMLRKGWIRAEWRVTENNRRARYYRLTASGRRELEAKAARWRRTSEAVNGILALRPSEEAM
ncbi:MAG TPA: PadR family transcriptional regulator [Vicinamibacteria bacterium]|nr:PadR family transcriptional regulator [Vicinamibacteria bacterium]